MGKRGQVGLESGKFFLKTASVFSSYLCGCVGTWQCKAAFTPSVM